MLKHISHTIRADKICEGAFLAVMLPDDNFGLRGAFTEVDCIGVHENLSRKTKFTISKHL
jgi:hypothetical protein